MPTISMFYGIIIRMYCSPGEHNPPHIHIYYNDFTANWNLAQNGELPFSIEPLK